MSRIYAGHKPLAVMLHWPCPLEHPYNKALMGAAPELLDALKECMEVACAETCDHINPTTIHTHECLRARAVIAKAETI